jgi:hypothetical protein
MNTSSTPIPPSAAEQEPTGTVPAGAETMAPAPSPAAPVAFPRVPAQRIVVLVAASVALSLGASLVARLLARSNQARMRPLIGDRSAVIALPFSAGVVVVNSVPPARRWSPPSRFGRPQRGRAARRGPTPRQLRRAVGMAAALAAARQARQATTRRRG